MTPAGLTIAAVPERGDPRDALVGSTLDGLGPGACVATGSARRQAQLSWLRPDLTFAGLRGNIATRLDKAAGFGAVVMAVAALDRLGLRDRAAEVLSAEVMVPQVGQGALAVECRADDDDILARLRPIEHEPSRAAVDAERGFLEALGGDCDLPAGAHAVIDGDSLRIDGFIASLDGRILLRAQRVGADPAPTGRSLAHFLLEDTGAAALLTP